MWGEGSNLDGGGLNFWKFDGFGRAGRLHSRVRGFVFGEGGSLHFCVDITLAPQTSTHGHLMSGRRVIFYK